MDMRIRYLVKQTTDKARIRIKVRGRVDKTCGIFLQEFFLE